MVTLRLGSTLSADDIKEGDDVYLECEVLANPSWRKLSWLQNVINTNIIIIIIVIIIIIITIILVIVSRALHYHKMFQQK